MNNPAITDPTLELLRDALQIADAAARAYIESESLAVDRYGVRWWDTRPALNYGEWRLHISYLKRRGLIEQDKAEPWIVRLKEAP